VQPVPDITVVVATHKRPRALLDLLSSLTRQTLPADRFDVAVVIDGVDECEPAYREVFEQMRTGARHALRYEFQANAGQSVARHRAILASSSRWLCIVDDDMELLPEFLSTHLALLSAGGERAVVIGRVIPERDWRRAPLYEAVRTSHMLEWHDRLARSGEAPWGQTLVTQNVSFGRGFYLEVGGFDKDLRLGEDSELGLRFERAGASFVFGDRAAAIHHSRVGSYEAWLRRSFEYGRVAVLINDKLRGDVRAHPLRNLVNGSRLNAAAVHALCWSDWLTRSGIAILRTTGRLLYRVGLTDAAIATHKAILAIAFHHGVKGALGSWPRVLAAKQAFASAPDAPREPT
jgi:GT2 family glycosyltransferase